MTKSIASAIADAIHRNFTSPDVCDGNLEAANVVDVLNHLANKVGAAGVRRDEKGKLKHNIVDGLFEIAAALHQVAWAIRSCSHNARTEPPTVPDGRPAT
jgi:hypothetical protein